jgi:CheY-like chemotaxis protein
MWGRTDAETQERENHRTTRPSSRRILIVDDNVDAATTLSELLKMWGHDVRVVYDGLAALETAPIYQPNVILLDIGLPGMNGYEVARKLRQKAGLSQTILIALTGYGQREDQDQFREVGFDYHFTKPIDPAALRSILDTRN